MLISPDICLPADAAQHICYNDCWNTSVLGGTELFFHGGGGAAAGLVVGSNCTTSCYSSACIGSCMHNCTVEEELAALPPCVVGPLCRSELDCEMAATYGNCSAAKAFQPTVINITALTENITVFVPEWSQEVVGSRGHLSPLVHMHATGAGRLACCRSVRRR